jgi:hypothetical protein
MGPRATYLERGVEIRDPWREHISTIMHRHSEHYERPKPFAALVTADKPGIHTTHDFQDHRLDQSPLISSSVANAPSDMIFPAIGPTNCKKGEGR